ncbi:MarR family winged helix-turn-helix transcriptional regulator [Planotetraspora phitsanulokensis]|uniref:MarR family transcriptional regulator n=1 Tax=Planotetraspora phitsanulokensis TaxID=575192 RepID=A0A8J3U7N3_9ACTN|nr:MarR family winged helix-turn-helix transcriptional regulator [Planotetraspora phitsanulokensis]GII39551.1 MarR family transcriptional regulator [Planotetraspora phitsanulokensis]
MALEDVPTATSSTDRLGLLLARHGAIANVRIRDALGANGLTHRQGVALMNLASAGRMSQQALLETLEVDPSVLVVILNDLERDGLVERRRDPADRRRHIVEITPAGRKAQSVVEDAIAAVERDLFADLDDEQVAQLRLLLSRVRTSINDPACTEA